MRIINENDSRFKLLPKLWDRLDSVELTTYSSGGGLRYLIPMELVNNEFERWTSRGNYISASKSWDSYIITYRFESIFHEATGLTKQDYFDLVMLKINETELRPRCSICNKPLEFSGKLGQGYRAGGGTGMNDDSITPYYCSASCRSIDIMASNWKYNHEHMLATVRKYGFKYNWDNNYEMMFNSVHNPITAALICYNRFLSTVQTNSGYFYVIEGNGKIKIGVSCYLPYGRFGHTLNYLIRTRDIKYAVYESTPEVVAELEYDVKLMLEDLTDRFEDNSELFVTKPNLFNIIKNISSQCAKYISFTI